MSAVWITEDKRSIPIKNLSTRHLCNVIRMLVKASIKQKRDATVMYMAHDNMDYVNLSSVEIAKLTFDPKFSQLCTELKKRNVFLNTLIADL